MQAGMVFTLANLIGFAVNDPKKMPKFEKVFPDPSRKAKAQSPAELLASMDSWARRINASRLTKRGSDDS